MLKVGEMWRWTINSYDNPTDPSYNIFLVLDSLDGGYGFHVLYLRDGKRVHYTSDTFIANKNYLQRIA